MGGMSLLLCVMILPLLLVMVLLILLLKNRNQSNPYDVFEFALDNKLVVCAGIPVTYNIADINNIKFSVMHRRGGYIGVFRLEMLSGKKSRPFLFDYSAYTKAMVLRSTRQNIEQAAEYLMDELRTRDISCVFVR